LNAQYNPYGPIKCRAHGSGLPPKTRKKKQFRAKEDAPRWKGEDKFVVGSRSVEEVCRSLQPLREKGVVRCIAVRDVSAFKKHAGPRAPRGGQGKEK